MDLTARIKALALECDMDYVGIAPVSRFKNAPPLHRPEDILPGAVSVISMSIRMNQGPVLTQRRALANRKLWHTAFSYRWFAYGCLNMYFLDRAAIQVARLLESEGYLAVPIVASGVENNKELIALFSNRHAGVAAGIAEMGWNGLALTPDNGPRQRFVTVITTARLEPDPLYDGPKVCDLEKCRELGGGEPLCTKLCPLKCFNNDEFSEIQIEDKVHRYAQMDHYRCIFVAALMGRPDIPVLAGRVQPDEAEQPSNEELKVKMRSPGPAISVIEPMIFKRGHTCGICVIRCPAGSPQPIDKIISSVKEAA